MFECLRSGLVERDEALWLGLLAAVAGEHYLLVGPPGTAKSLLARRLHRAFRGRYFERLLTRFTVPEEIFGPLSLRGLERDVYERLGEGYLSTATIAFLDEIFKANSAILNSLLGILNERVLDQGARRDPVPLVSLVGASNELPAGDELAALSDRFVVRYVVGPVSREGFASLLGADEAELPDVPEELTLSETDLAEVRRAAAAVALPEWVTDLLGHVRELFTQKGVYVSDRRWRRAVHLLRVAAVLDGRTAVTLADLDLLRHLLWLHATDRETVATTLRRAFVDTFLAEPERFGALVASLEKALVGESTEQAQAYSADGPLFVDEGGADTLAPSSRRPRRTEAGEFLFHAPPGSSRYACTAAQLREHLTASEAAAWVRDPSHRFIDDVPNKVKLVARTFSEEHVARRLTEVDRLRAHLADFQRTIAAILEGPATEGGARERGRACECAARRAGGASRARA